jgi:hypothetical protein
MGYDPTIPKELEISTLVGIGNNYLADDGDPYIYFC